MPENWRDRKDFPSRSAHSPIRGMNFSPFRTSVDNDLQNGAAERTRTFGLLLRRQTLYPLSYGRA